MDLEIALDARGASGKENRRLRREGFVPGVVFGKGADSTPVQLEAKAFETLWKAAGRTSIVKIKVDGARTATSAIIKNVQRNPLTGRALHVDFFLVDLKHTMDVNVPLVFSGEAPGVEATGGSVIHQLDHVLVRALPAEIPHEIEVDVASLVDLEAAIHVRDLAIDTSRVEILNDGDELVAKILPPRVEEEPETVAAEAGEEGAEGEAPADADADADGERPETDREEKSS